MKIESNCVSWFSKKKIETGKEYIENSLVGNDKIIFWFKETKIEDKEAFKIKNKSYTNTNWEIIPPWHEFFHEILKYRWIKWRRGENFLLWSEMKIESNYIGDFRKKIETGKECVEKRKIPWLEMIKLFLYCFKKKKKEVFKK